MDLYAAVGMEPPSLRRRDIAANSGVDPERSVRWWRAMGFPEVADDTLAFNLVDLDLTSRLGELEHAGLLEDDDLLRVTRLMGASFQRIAEAQLDLVAELLASVPGSDPDLLASERLAALIDQEDPALMRLLERSVVFVWQRHMLAALGRRLETDENSDELAVGFADLTGFTKLAKSLDADDLATLIDAFEAIAFDVVAGSEGRVVKLIGDEVMFVAPTLADAARIAINLRDRLAAEPSMPPVHCGLAFGSTVAVGGDVFGSTVNLASRLTSVTRRGRVVIPRDQAVLLADADDLMVRPARRTHALKGIGETRLAVVERVTPESAPEPEPNPETDRSPEA